MKKLITITVLVWVLCGVFTYNAHAWWFFDDDNVEVNLTYITKCKTYVYSSGGYAVAILPKNTVVSVEEISDDSKYVYATWLYEGALQHGWITTVHLKK